MPPKKYTEFLVSEPYDRLAKYLPTGPNQMRPYVNLTCPHCLEPFREILACNVGHQKAGECLEHLRHCSAAADAGVVVPPPRKRVAADNGVDSNDMVEKPVGVEPKTKEEKQTVVIKPVEEVVRAVATQPSLSTDELQQLIQRMRSSRSRAIQGPACDIAFVLSVAPSIDPAMNATQCDEFLQAFLKAPKQTLGKTLRSLYRDDRDRQLACPRLAAWVESLDGLFAGSNWERSVVVHMGTQAKTSVAQFIAELRLSRPDQYVPTEQQRASSALLQYVEVYAVFEGCRFVSTADVASFFKGQRRLGVEQTALEAAGPECWLAICERMGYPSKPFAAYEGKFCTDHIVERSLFTKHPRAQSTTPADTLSNYAMLLGFFNEQGRMKMFGMEKRGWYGEAAANAAKASMQFRIDFFVEKRRFPTNGEFVKSTSCDESWRPRIALLKRTHVANRKRTLTQSTLD